MNDRIYVLRGRFIVAAFSDFSEQDSDHLLTLLTSRQIKELRALRSRKGRAENGRFVAEGVRVVEDLLASDLTLCWVATASSLEDTDRGAELREEIGRRGVPTTALEEREISDLSLTDAPQGIIAVAETPAYEFASLDLSATPAILLVLDAVQDPGNFGTLARSAEALGASGIIALPGTVDPWNPKAVRAAAGASFRIPVVQAAWTETVDFLHSRQVSVLGAAADGRPVSAAQYERAAVVVGNEGAGLSREVRASVDEIVGVPLRGRAESLNVAAAAAILLYELTR